jgi:hypothetical protein
MRFVSGFFGNRLNLRIDLGLRTLFLCSMVLCASLAYAQAQTAPPASAPSSAAAPAVAGTTGKAHASATSTHLPWTALTPSQRQALAPLAETWGAFSETRKRKWIVIANSLPTLSETERAKLHERMEDWAKLSSKERDLARLNFTQSKNLTKSDRAANWEAYQALSVEERQRLAAQATRKPTGAAVAAKAAPAERLVPIPLTRHTPESARNALAMQMQLNPNTLLPRKPAASSASAPSKR